MAKAPNPAPKVKTPNLIKKKKCAKKDTEILTLDLTLEEIGSLALLAHEKDVTLNEFIVDVLIDEANRVILEHEQKV